MERRVKNYTLYNLTLTLANTEYTQAITSNSCFVRVCSADLTSTARVSLTVAGSATGRVIFQGSEWFTPRPLGFGVKNIYMQTQNAGAVYQIEVFELD
jgi:hypothetical protein